MAKSARPGIQEALFQKGSISFRFYLLVFQRFIVEKVSGGGNIQEEDHISTKYDAIHATI